VRSPFDFLASPARNSGRLWTITYAAALIALFNLAAVRRFSLPLTPILDIDSPNFLWPALLKLNGHGFVHNAGLNFIYPGFLFVVLRGFADFRAVVVVQHLLGLAGGAFFLLGWNRLHDLDRDAPLRRAVHQAIGLFSAGLFLLSPTTILFEMQIRPEAVCMPVQLLSFWLLFEFLFCRTRTDATGRLALAGLGAMASALLLCSLKPSFTLAALFTALLVLLLVVRSGRPPKFRILFCAGALLIALALFIPERRLGRDDRLSRMFLPQTLFSVHARIIHEQMKEDLARETETPFPRPWLLSASNDLGAALQNCAVPAGRQFSLLGFDPDCLMNGSDAVITRWLVQLGGDQNLRPFLAQYFWRAVRHRPRDFGEKIRRQLGVFYRWTCPAFISQRRIALAAWHYQPSLAVIRDPETWEQLGAVPGGPDLLARTEALAAERSLVDSGKRPFFFQSIFGRAYLPILVLSFAAALYVLWSRKYAGGGRAAAALVLFLFLMNFANVLAIAVVHSMEVLRYSTVQFAAALFAELWAIRFLLGFALRELPGPATAASNGGQPVRPAHPDVGAGGIVRADVFRGLPPGAGAGD
jgi:hypothetical protein